MTSIIWLTGLSLPACLGAACYLKDSPVLSAVIAAAGFVPLMIGCAGFVYFGLTNPDLLQSEEHRARQRALQMIESKGGRIKLNPIDLKAISNPDPSPKMLEHRPPSDRLSSLEHQQADEVGTEEEGQEDA